MPDIFHIFPIRASAARVFDGVATPAGLDTWWTLTSSGQPAEGTEYELGFGPGYNWRAVVARSVPGAEFSLQFTSAHEDWDGTKVRFQLAEKDGVTTVRFSHTGWPHDNEHYRVSCFCWAMYLRLLKRNIEHDEIVPYERRLDA